MPEKKRKVGIMIVSLPRERTDLAQKFGKKASMALGSAGFTVIMKDELIFDSEACVRAAKEYVDSGVDCIILLLGTWVSAPTVVDTVREIDFPFAVWAEDNPASFSLTAGGIVHGSLDELGLKHRFFYGSPDSKALLEDIAAFIRAGAAANDLNGNKLCVVGGRVMGMYTTMADIIQLKHIFGLEVEHIDGVRVYLEAENVAQEQVSKMRKWLEETFGKINVPEQILERSLRLYIALKYVLEKEGYNLVAVKCQDEMINNYASSCLAISLLNDEGFTVSCESDINAAITMRMLSSISGGISLFGDINHLDQENKVLRVVNCGSMPTLMAENRGDVDLNLQYEYMGKAQGTTTVFCVKESPVTISRLSRIKGKFVLLAADGNTQKVEKDKFKETREHWPHAFIKLDGDMQILIENFRSNHMHLCFGHHSRSLKEFCRLKDIGFLSL